MPISFKSWSRYFPIYLPPSCCPGRFTNRRRSFAPSAVLRRTSWPDAATRAALGIDGTVSTTTYTITVADEELVGPWPKTWFDKADAKFLGYNSLANLVAERGHCSVDLLGRLNRRMNLGRLHA